MGLKVSQRKLFAKKRDERALESSPTLTLTVGFFGFNMIHLERLKSSFMFKIFSPNKKS